MHTLRPFVPRAPQLADVIWSGLSFNNNDPGVTVMKRLEATQQLLLASFAEGSVPVHISLEVFEVLALIL